MVYFIEKGNSAARFGFNRAIFPYNIQSHSGKYCRKSNGLLKKYEKITKSVILFEEKYYESLKELVIKFKVDARFFKVEEI